MIPAWRGLSGRRGGMVDATDLKSVEGQPSWGFESPRRHMGVRGGVCAGVAAQGLVLSVLRKAMTSRISRLLRIMPMGGIVDIGRVLLTMSVRG